MNEQLNKLTVKELIVLMRQAEQDRRNLSKSNKNESPSSKGNIQG